MPKDSFGFFNATVAQWGELVDEFGNLFFTKIFAARGLGHLFQEIFITGQLGKFARRVTARRARST